MTIDRSCFFAVLCFGAIVASLGGNASAQEEDSPFKISTPLYRQDPHDLITIQGRGTEAHQVLPIDLPNRRVPASKRPDDKIHVRFLDRPDEEYEIQWRHVASLQLFEDRILAEVVRLVNNERFDDAFPQIEYLRQNYPRLEGVNPALEAFLHGSTRKELKADHARSALSLLNDLHALNASRSGLADDLASAVERLVDGYLQRDEVPSARALLASFIAKYPSHAQIARWRARFASEANVKLEAAQQAVTAHAWSDARRAALSALARRPEWAEARELVTTLAQRDAQIRVAVRTPPRSTPSLSPLDRLLDFAARRDDRLLAPGWIELTEIGPSGGHYQPQLGTLDRDADGQLVWRLPIDGPVTGYDLARRLWHRADPQRDGVHPVWASLLRSVEVRDVYQTTITLNHPHLLPEALLVAVSRGSKIDPAAQRLSAGNFILARHAPGEQTFARQPGDGVRGPAELVESYYPTERELLAKLLSPQIDVIDQIELAEVAEWRQRKEYVVETYRVPSVHLLALRRTSGLMQQRTFRRGLIYALDRARMFDQLVLRDQKIAGCELISGPFSRGLGTDDPLGYALNPLVKPRPYDPELAATLIALARSERTTPAAADAKTTVDKKAAKIDAPLRLAHPATAQIRAVVKAIARQWEQVGVSVQLVELLPGDSGWNSNCDILYAQVTSAEPLIDARVLLGEQGIGGANPYLTLALGELDRAADWTEARRILQQIHQLVHDDATLIPLWQLTEHFARHRSLAGIGKSPLTLFQHLDEWRLTPDLPPVADPLWPASGGVK